MTDGAVHQGLAARVPAYEYAHPDDLLDRAAEARRAAADRGARLGDRPAQPRRGRALARPGSAPTACVDPGASGRADDRQRVEDLGRRRGPGAGGAGGQPGADAQGLPGRRLHGGRPGRRRRRRRPAPTSTWPPGRSWSWSAPRARACRGWCARPATGCVSDPDGELAGVAQRRRRRLDRALRHRPGTADAGAEVYDDSARRCLAPTRRVTGWRSAGGSSRSGIGSWPPRSTACCPDDDGVARGPARADPRDRHQGARAAGARGRGARRVPGGGVPAARASRAC